MPGLTHEEDSLGSNPGTKGLARHLFTRMSCGKIVIVADRPEVIHASLRKQWLKLARKVQREQSSTLNATRVLRLSEMASRMQTMRFTTKWPDDFEADVFIVNIDQLIAWPPDCRTLYVTSDISMEQLHIAAALMPKGALVALCRFV